MNQPVSIVQTSGKFRLTEESEFDPNFKKKQRKKQYLILLGVVVGIVILSIFYYKTTHVPMPNFVNKPVSEARNWAAKNKIELELKQSYNLKKEANQVIRQKEKSGKQIRKGRTIELAVSLGADPDGSIQLPDFAKMSEQTIDQWIKENQAENLKLIKEYSDSEEKGQYLRFEIKNKDVTAATYKRKDNASVYYSKGKEIFEKNIKLPNFVGKTKSEVETWAKANEIQVTYEETDSNDRAVDQIISQTIAENEKIAKKDSMSVTVSLGKAVIVPYFGNLSAETASMIADLNVSVRKMYSTDVAFGHLISQSVAADTKLTTKDDQKVVVVYSEGRPYLKDYRGITEGELQKQFYDDYQSKGANVLYTIDYVDSTEAKGTVVKMSTFNEYIPLDYTVAISISKGNLVGAEEKSANKNTSE
ncbi:PASTA domain-containing protein [Carnobacterium gallinarum]|uniref:PASTA domain-containing protein n=1 Tax=Carnobacterium gallinarum TaxID=2749 RepID=UPI000B0600A8|nr:PASTA domain-containing protein [Carnobacterium gallinarum]